MKKIVSRSISFAVVASFAVFGMLHAQQFNGGFQGPQGMPGVPGAGPGEMMQMQRMINAAKKYPDIYPILNDLYEQFAPEDGEGEDMMMGPPDPEYLREIEAGMSAGIAQLQQIIVTASKDKKGRAKKAFAASAVKMLNRALKGIQTAIKMAEAEEGFMKEEEDMHQTGMQKMLENRKAMMEQQRSRMQQQQNMMDGEHGGPMMMGPYGQGEKGFDMGKGMMNNGMGNYGGRFGGPGGPSGFPGMGREGFPGAPGQFPGGQGGFGDWGGMMGSGGQSGSFTGGFSGGMPPMEGGMTDAVSQPLPPPPPPPSGAYTLGTIGKGFFKFLGIRRGWY